MVNVKLFKIVRVTVIPLPLPSILTPSRYLAGYDTSGVTDRVSALWWACVPPLVEIIGQSQRDFTPTGKG